MTPTPQLPSFVGSDTMSASRNIYKDDIDFTALALQSPEFAK